VAFLGSLCYATVLSWSTSKTNFFYYKGYKPVFSVPQVFLRSQ
jgi:hypothetical protein